MLAGIFTASMLVENLCSSLDKGSFPGDFEPGCLHQNAISSTDLFVDATGVVEVANIANSPMTPKSTVLFESVAVEESNTSKLLVGSKSRSRSCEGYLVYLDRKADRLVRAHNVSNIKMEELIKVFISKQSGSQDACSSQLLEAKHQLNQIHELRHVPCHASQYHRSSDSGPRQRDAEQNQGGRNS